MQMLPKLARALMKKDFKAALAAATTEAEVVRIVSDEVVDPLEREPAAASDCRPHRRCRCTAQPSACSTSSVSRRARPASPTPTWRPRAWRTPRRPPATR